MFWLIERNLFLLILTLIGRCGSSLWRERCANTHVRRSVRQQNTTSLWSFYLRPGAAPGPGAALGALPIHQRGPPPNLGCRGSPAAKTHVRYQEASPESGESRERAPDELARPTHVLDSPPAPSEGPGAPARPTFSNGPAGREPRSHPRSLRRRTSTGRGPTTSRRSSATA